MSHIRLLLIDEKSFTASLDRAGYRNKGVIVYTAHDYPSALKTITAKDIDIVSLNLDFQGQNSIDIIKQLKSNVPKSIPFIVTSVQTSAKIQKAALKNGADLFVEQPVPREFFIEKIKSTLDQAVRDNKRISAIGSISLELEQGNLSLDINDLSTTGILVDYSEAVQEGQSVRLTLQLEDMPSKFSIDGSIIRVINNNDKKGVGIRFENFKGKDKSKLQKYIDQHHIESSQLKYYM
ncbi:response regulator [bacterium]|nr:response regulator [bacterium]